MVQIEGRNEGKGMRKGKGVSEDEKNGERNWPW